MRKENLYERYTLEIARLLSQVPNAVDLEKIIKRKLKKNMEKSRGGYFNLDDLMTIPEINKYIKIIVITGDRNIGKSYSLRDYVCNNYESKSEKFIWLRTQQKSSEDALNNDSITYAERGWLTLGKLGEVIVPKDDNKNASTNNRLDTVGWYVGLSSVYAKKSIQYPKTSTIIFDEFNDGITVKDKYYKMVSFVSTVFRRNTKARVFFMANYLNQNDPILATLGMKQSKGKVPMLTFNWITRAMMWNIPPHQYTQLGDDDLLAYRMAVAGGINTFRKEYGGEFSNYHQYNIKELGAFIHKKDIAYFLIDNIKLIFGKSKKTNAYYVVDYEKRPRQKLPEIVFYENDLLKNKPSKMISDIFFRKLKKMWKQELLFTDEILIAELMIEILTSKKVEDTPLVSYL